MSSTVPLPTYIFTVDPSNTTNILYKAPTLSILSNFPNIAGQNNNDIVVNSTATGLETVSTEANAKQLGGLTVAPNFFANAATTQAVFNTTVNGSMPFTNLRDFNIVRAGWYQISATICISTPNPTGDTVYLIIGSTTGTGNITTAYSSVACPVNCSSINNSVLVKLSVGDLIGCFIYNNSGGAFTGIADSAIFKSQFSIKYII